MSEEAISHNDRFLDSLDRRLDDLFKVVYGGHDSIDPLLTQMGKVVENQQEDREKLSNLERKIDNLAEKQHKDLLEIKEAIYNLGTIGMFLRRGGWKLIGALLALFFGVGGWLTWTYDHSVPPRVFVEPTYFEKLKEVIKETVIEILEDAN